MIPLTNDELTQKMFELDERVTRHTEQINNCNGRLDSMQALTDSIHRMATSLEVLANAQKSTEKKVDTLHKDVEEIKSKPAKNWENSIRLIFELILTAIVTWVLVKTGLK